MVGVPKSEGHRWDQEPKGKRESTVTTADDISRALISWVQDRAFSEEIAELKKKGLVKANSTVIKLSPICVEGML